MRQSSFSFKNYIDFTHWDNPLENSFDTYSNYIGQIRKYNKKGIFNYKQANRPAMNSEIRSINWNEIFQNETIISSWNIFKSKLDIIMRKYIPMVTVKFKRHPPWFDNEIH